MDSAGIVAESERLGFRFHDQVEKPMNWSRSVTW